MEFRRVENPTSPEFREAWRIYDSSFPSDEKEDLKKETEIFKRKNYSFYAVYKDGVMVGIITDWKFGKFLFVEDLAVREDLRGQGIGTELLRLYLQRNKQSIILEVERPATEAAKKRIRFYEEIGFKLNEFDYTQPSYGKGKNPVPMFLMSFPKKISATEFSVVRKKIHTKVYGLRKPLVNCEVSKT